MLSRGHRLRKDFEIARTCKVGRSTAGKYLFMKYLPKEFDTPPRFAFTISKKIAKRAHTRNQIKRRLRETVRNHKDIWQSGDYVFIVRTPDIEHASFASLTNDIEYLLRTISTR